MGDYSEFEGPGGTRRKGHPDGPSGSGGVPVPVGTGRVTGSKNKMTQQVKEMIADAFERLGGVEGLTAWAAKSDENLGAFYTKLWAKLLPLRVDLSAESKEYRSLDEVRQELERHGLMVPILELTAETHDSEPDEKVQP